VLLTPATYPSKHTVQATIEYSWLLRTSGTSLEDWMRLLKITRLFVTAMAACGWGNASAQSLYSLPPGVETRWASPENPLGEKSKGAQANGGRKGAAAVSIKANQQITLAEVHGASGTVRRIWATMNDRSPEMVRGLTLQMFWDGCRFANYLACILLIIWHTTCARGRAFRYTASVA
jgi:hypothetical protein